MKNLFSRKRITFLLLIAMICLTLFVLSSCDDVNKIDLPDPDKTPQTTLGENFTETLFEVQYVRTGWSSEYEKKITDSKVIHSKRELDDYYELKRNEYDLERREDPASDSTIGFLDACDRYTEKFFEDHILLMVTTGEPSGSIRHKAENVYSSKEKLEVYIKKVVPEVFTEDMAGWHILIELPKDVEGKENVTVYFDGIDPLKTNNFVRQRKGSANISLNVPYDWKYELEDSEDGKGFCIAISPEREMQGKLKIWYYDVFAVCGTGLKEEKIRLGKYEAYQGTYEGDPLWYFISFRGLAGSYVVINDGAEVWWEDYGEKAMEILETLTLAEGVITEEEAIAIAKNNVNTNFDTVRADFQSEKGIWQVTLSNQNSQRGVRVYRITSEGKIVDLAIGDGKR